MNALRRLCAKADRFTTGIILSVILGLVVPCSGVVAEGFGILTNAAIVLLFYLYGVKLSR